MITPSKFTSPKSWPRYTEAEQQLLGEFLAAYGAAAMAAVEKAEQMDEAAPGNHVILGTIRYWQNACSVIAWLAGKVPQRQRQVAIFRAASAAQAAGEAP